MCHLPFVICHPASAIRHLPSVIRHLPSVIRHLPSVIRHLTFAIRLFAFPIPRSEFLLPHFSKGFERSQQLPGLGRLVTPEPLEPRAQIERRAVGPVGVRDRFDGLVAGQQLLEVLDVVRDDRVEDLGASAALLGRATISRQHWRWLKEGSVRNRSSRKFSHSSAANLGTSTSQATKMTLSTGS